MTTMTNHLEIYADGSSHFILRFNGRTELCLPYTLAGLEVLRQTLQARATNADKRIGTAGQLTNFQAESIIKAWGGKPQNLNKPQRVPDPEPRPSITLADLGLE